MFFPFLHFLSFVLQESPASNSVSAESSVGFFFATNREQNPDGTFSERLSEGKEIVFGRVNEFGEAIVVKDFNVAGLAQDFDHLMLFFHGYNMTFQYGLACVRDLGNCILSLKAKHALGRVAVMLFSWPSKGKISGYLVDSMTVKVVIIDFISLFALFTANFEGVFKKFGRSCCWFAGRFSGPAPSLDRAQYG